jgi:hypothetical protein
MEIEFMFSKCLLEILKKIVDIFLFKTIKHKNILKFQILPYKEIKQYSSEKLVGFLIKK